jgi:hypothetical protein
MTSTANIFNAVRASPTRIPRDGAWQSKRTIIVMARRSAGHSVEDP